jgi:hypothetical protein
VAKSVPEGVVGSLMGAGGGSIVGSFGGLKQVATRTQTIEGANFNTGAQTIMSTSVHTIVRTVTKLRLGFANWFIDNRNSGAAFCAETGTGSNMTLKVGVEYPASTFTQVKLGGSASIVLKSGFTTICDELAIAIPSGSLIKVHVWQNNTTGVLFAGNASATFGDRLSFDPTDRSMTGSVPNDNPGYVYPPTLILGDNFVDSIIGFSDSRFYGSGDTADATGDIGIFARGAGKQIAYCNCGVALDREDWFLASSAKRVALAGAFTKVGVGFGVNGASPIPTRIANVQLVYGKFPGRSVYGWTSSPTTTGGITQANGSDQIVSQDLGAYNIAVLTKPAPLVNAFDTAGAVCIVGTPTKWNINYPHDEGGGVFIHENQAGAKVAATRVDFGYPRLSGNILSAGQSQLTGWNATRLTRTAGALAAPDGTTTISSLVEDGSTNTHTLDLLAAYTTTANVYELSFLVKRLAVGAGRDVQLFVYDGAFANSVYVGFDLNAGAINVAATINSGTSFSAPYGRIIPVEGGFWRVTLGLTSIAGVTNLDLYILLQSAGLTNYAGNGVSGIYVGQADARIVT